MSDRPKRITLGVNKRLGLRVGGARVGDAARPAADGASDPTQRAAGTVGARFGLRVHGATLPTTTPTPDDEVA